VQATSVELEFFCGLRWGGNASPSSETRAVFNRYASVNRKTNKIPGANFATRKLKNLVRQAAFSLGAASRKIDLYHEPNFISFKCDKPTVITVHDMSPFRLARHHKPDLVKLFEERLPGAISGAAAIIVDSVFVKNEVVDYFPEENCSIITTSYAYKTSDDYVDSIPYRFINMNGVYSCVEDDTEYFNFKLRRILK
jgi:hypothetical protein